MNQGARRATLVEMKVGDRARIRPNGGHMGNLSYQKTIAALQDYFAP